MSSLLKKSFKASKCKTLLKLTVSRIKLLRSKRIIVAKQARNDVASFLQHGQESNARVRVEHVFREENMLAAYDLIERFCESVNNRLPSIESQKDCPPDLKESIASLIYAAPRVGDLQELQKIRELFTSKYGKEFAVIAMELRPDCGVHSQIVQRLSTHAPNLQTKLKLMKEIAAEHKVDWDPGRGVSESLKPSEDLLGGPTRSHTAIEVSKTDAPLVTEGSNEKNTNTIFAHPVFPSNLKGTPPSVLRAASDNKIAPSASPFNVSPFQPVFPLNHKGQPPSVHLAAAADNTISSSASPFHVSPSLPSSFATLDGFSPDIDIYSKAKAEGKMDYKSMGNPWTDTDTDHGVLSPEVNPYARAKAEGRMDYKNVSDLMGKVTAHDETQQNEETVKRNQEAVFYHPVEVETATSRHYNTPNSCLKDSEDGGDHQNVSLAQELSDRKLIRPTRPPSFKLITSDSNSRENMLSEYPDVATAAQVAFESAALAAEAARAAIDLAHCDSIKSSNRKMERDEDLNSGKKVAETIRNNRVDSKQSFKVYEYGKDACKEKDEMTKETAYTSIPHSNLHVGSSEFSRASTNTTNHDAGEECLDEPARHFHSQRKGRKCSTDTDSRTDENIRSHWPEEPAQNLRNSPRWSDTEVLLDTRDTELKDHHQALCNEGSRLTPGQDSGEDGRAKFLSSSWKHQSNSYQKGGFEKEYEPQVPKFDNYDSSESSDVEAPFYMKGRAAIGIEEYEEVRTTRPFDMPHRSSVFSETRNTSPLTPQQTDSEEEPTPESLKFNNDLEITMAVERESQQIAERDYFGRPQFDDYVEPAEISEQMSSRASSKSPVMSRRPKGRDDRHFGLRGNALTASLATDNVSDHKPRKASNHKLGWHSSTSEEFGVHSQAELNASILSSHEEDHPRVHLREWNLRTQEPDELASERSLKWHSSTSVSSDFPSKDDDQSPRDEKICSAELTSSDEDETRAHKLEQNPVIQANRRQKSGEAYAMQTSQGPQTLKGKSFYGESRRSVRSSRPKQRPELLAPTSRHESTYSNFPSMNRLMT